MSSLVVKALASSRIPLEHYGDFLMTVYQNSADNAEHFTLVKAYDVAKGAPLVRIHSECITGDLFGSTKCDCGSQLEQSLMRIAAEGGVLVYLRQEGRGIGLVNKLRAYALQEQGFDTVEANQQLGLPIDNRDYAVAYEILTAMGIREVRLLTNNPQKISSLEHYGMIVCERIGLEIKPTLENLSYLQIKQNKMGHLLMLKPKEMA